MVKEKFIHRTNLLKELHSHLGQKEITLLIGPRQAGKTTIMEALQADLEKRGEKTLFLSLDFERDKNFFVSQEALLQRLRLAFGSAGGGYVFIDEIQRKENAGLFLKGIYDQKPSYKFIVSGSGSLELKEKIHESLAGRKLIFEILPISFLEFADYYTDYKYENRLEDFFSIDTNKALQLLDFYLRFGGYPRVITANDEAEKRKVIDEIYQAYLEKDASALLRVEKLDAFSSLIKVLAGQVGKMIRFSELSSTLGISLVTVKNYLWYLEKTFILERSTPFFRNIRKEITKSPVAYFYDLGLRNHACNIFGQTLRVDDAGFLFQNFIFNILREKTQFTASRVHFWRTKDKAEVDFVMDVGLKPLPIEVKYSSMPKPAIEKSLRRFIDAYHPENAYVINLSLDETVNLNGTKVRFLPFYKVQDIFCIKRR